MAKRYKENLINEIKKVREKEKLSFKELERRYKIPGSTIKNWCKGTVGTKWDYLILNNERRRNEIRQSEKSCVSPIDKLSRRQAKFYASLLYGCEGSKYPAQKGVAFANSDPKLILTFLSLLRKGFDLDTKKFSVHLQIHTTHDFNELKKYWANFLTLSEECFIKPTVTTPKGGKHREIYMGTCTLRYYDYKIQLKMLGIFEVFLASFIPN